MKYRILGKTGLQVSEIGLGGEWLERLNTAGVAAVIHRAEEAGINILDCFMSNPDVRTNLGLALTGRREKWVIQGHLCSVWENGQYGKSRDLRKTKEAFSDLLSRLQTDYLDLGMIHYVDTVEDFETVVRNGIWDYALDLKKRGVIHHLGISSHDPVAASYALRTGEIEAILFSINPAFDMLAPGVDIMEMFTDNPFNDDAMANIASERDQFYRLCEREGVGLTVMKGYGGGRLLSAKTSPFGVALTPVQCLHYALTRPAVASVVAGYESTGQVDDAVAYETASEAERDFATVLANAPRHAFTGQCAYCGHCAPCPSKIDVAMVNKLYDLAEQTDPIPETIRDHYRSLPANASDCVTCGACESRCPFGVPVIERMKSAKTLFGI